MHLNNLVLVLPCPLHLLYLLELVRRFQHVRQRRLWMVVLVLPSLPKSKVCLQNLHLYQSKTRKNPSQWYRRGGDVAVARLLSEPPCE